MYKRNLQISIAKKLEIIEYYKIHGKNKAAQNAGVSIILQQRKKDKRNR